MSKWNETIQKMTTRADLPIATEAHDDDWVAECLVCHSVFSVPGKNAPENPAPHGSFCPDCRARKRMAPGVLHWARRGSSDDPKDKLWALCEAFIQKHDITVPETIYQQDKVIENAYEFIEAICDIVGYVNTEEEEDDDV